MVETARPLHAAASVRQESTRFPSTRTVHAPHAPWPQPFFVPVNPSRSRSASRNVTRASTVSACPTPLTRSVTANRVIVPHVPSRPMPPPPDPQPQRQLASGLSTSHLSPSRL